MIKKRIHAARMQVAECAVCHHRFWKSVMICPKCGTRFTGKIEDNTEWYENEDELEEWDEEDNT